jgi:hypothetical protein
VKNIAVSAYERATAHVPLNEAFGFELRVGVRDRGTVHAEDLREFAAGWDAITRTQVAGVNEGAQLVTQLNIEGDVAFGLKV